MYFLCTVQACGCAGVSVCECPMSFSVTIQPPYCPESRSLNEPEAHHFLLTWLAPECSGSTHSCPHCWGHRRTWPLPSILYRYPFIQPQQVLRLSKTALLSTKPSLQSQQSQSRFFFLKWHPNQKSPIICLPVWVTTVMGQPYSMAASIKVR